MRKRLLQLVQRYYAEVSDWRELDSEQTAAIIEHLK